MFSWYYIQINRGYLLMLFILYKTHNIDPWQAVQSLPGKNPKTRNPKSSFNLVIPCLYVIPIHTNPL